MKFMNFFETVNASLSAFDISSKVLKLVNCLSLQLIVYACGYMMGICLDYFAFVTNKSKEELEKLTGLCRHDNRFCLAL